MSRIPRIGVGAVVTRDGAVLLVLRGQPPNQGQWAIPGGKLNWGETLRQAAEREIREETGVEIRAGEPLYTFEYLERDEVGEVAYHYVIIDLDAEYISGTPRAGDDALEARWVPLSELEQLPLNATTRRALRQLFPPASRS